jgi:hypothetical protein
MAMLAVNEQATTGALYAVNEPVATVDEPAVTVNEPAATAAVPMLAAVEQHQSTHDDAAEDSPPPFLARTSARVDVLKDGRLQERFWRWQGRHARQLQRLPLQVAIVVSLGCIWYTCAFFYLEDPQHSPPVMWVLLTLPPYVVIVCIAASILNDLRMAHRRMLPPQSAVMGLAILIVGVALVLPRLVLELTRNGFDAREYAER